MSSVSKSKQMCAASDVRALPPFGVKMSLCRACLVVLTPQDTAHDLHKEKDLALKFLACTGRGLDALLPPQDDTRHVVLKCLCESCYQLVQKFHAFQRMCEESLQNLEKLLLEADETKAFMDQLEEKPSVQNPAMAIEEIEEVYIVEDATTKQAQAKDFLTEKIPPPGDKQPRRRGQRATLNCSICMRGFYKPALLEAHLQKHKGEQPYRCVHCGKCYARRNLLETHLRDMHERCETQLKFACTEPNCNKVYNARRSLNLHISQHHCHNTEKPSAKHMCDKCGKTYGNKAHLTRHQWVHANKGERPFECTHCGQRFYTKQILADHLKRRHSTLHLLRCKKCGRILSSRLTLAAHMRKMHTNAKTWKCDSCQMEFSTLSNLRAHQRVVHAGLRPHGCGFCNATFSKRAHLDLHEMRHTGERAYKCVPCRRAFIQKVNFQRHMRLHHSDDASPVL